MKKLFSILFALLLTAGTLSGCGGDDTATDADDTTTAERRLRSPAARRSPEIS